MIMRHQIKHKITYVDYNLVSTEELLEEIEDSKEFLLGAEDVEDWDQHNTEIYESEEYQLEDLEKELKRRKEKDE